MKLTIEEPYDILSLKTSHKPTKSYKIDRASKWNICSKPILDVAKKKNRQKGPLGEQSRGPHRSMDKKYIPESRNRAQSRNFLLWRDEVFETLLSWLPSGLWISDCCVSHSSLFWIRVIIIWSSLIHLSHIWTWVKELNITHELWDLSWIQQLDVTFELSSLGKERGECVLCPAWRKEEYEKDTHRN